MPRNADDSIGFRVAHAIKAHWEEEARKDRRTLSQWVQLMVEAGERSQSEPRRTARKKAVSH